MNQSAKFGNSSFISNKNNSTLTGTNDRLNKLTDRLNKLTVSFKDKLNNKIDWN